MSATPLPPFGTYPPSPFQRRIMAAGRLCPHSYLGARASSWLRSLARATATGPIDVEVLGSRMRLDLSDNACERRLFVSPHYFDPGELAFLAPRITADFAFVDLGANVGTYALFVARRAGPAARILAIEPHPIVRARLEANIALNGYPVRVCEAAASDAAGTLELIVDAANIGVTSVHEDRPRRGAKSAIQVPTRPLLDIVCEHGFNRIDALKADIEGAEDRALMPFFAAAPETLWPRVLIIEDNAREWRGDLSSILARRGYQRRLEENGNVVWERG
jgi:FkbM family methyltransferase